MHGEEHEAHVAGGTGNAAEARERESPGHGNARAHIAVNEGDHRVHDGGQNGEGARGASGRAVAHLMDGGEGKTERERRNDAYKRPRLIFS